MNFSNPVKFSGQVKYSPNNKLVAYTNNMEVIIYKIENLQLINTFALTDIPCSIEWSYDSQFVMIGLFKKSIIEIRQINSSKQKNAICKIDEGYFGITFACFSPLSSKVVLLNEFGLGGKIFSLKDGSIEKINNTKSLINPCNVISFSTSRTLISFIQRVESIDFVSVYKFLPIKNSDNEQIDLLSCFESNTSDATSTMFTHDECFIIIFDSYLYNIIQIFDILGNLKQTISPYQMKLGVRSYALCPSYLAVGYYDENIKIFHTSSWNLITDIKTIENQIELVDELVAFNEVKEGFQNVYQLLEDGNILLNRLETNEIKEKGISKLEFSNFSSYLFGIYATLPNYLYIWKCDDFKLVSIVIQQLPITSVCYIKRLNSTFINTNDSVEQDINDKDSDNNNLIALATENKNIYLITPNEASVCSIPLEKRDHLYIDKIIWSSDGSSMLCSDRNCFFYCKLLTEQDNIEELPEEIEEDDN